MRLTLGQIADWIHAEGDFSTSTEVHGYSIDSRTVAAGELFFAVTGERVDGHAYVASALGNGAVAAVVSNRWLVPAEVDLSRLLFVPEGEECVLRALQALGKRVRLAWGRRVIGVTGSAGKTTTKEAIAEVLAVRFNVLKSAGNLNNHFGVPLQLLRLQPEHEIAVIEMGMNHAGELTALAAIAEPDWAVVSNVAAVHLEFFPDGIEGIARAKYELVQSLPANGIAILNADDPRVRGFSAGLGDRAIFYGTSPEAAVRAIEIEQAGLEGMRFTVQAENEKMAVRLALPGRHNVLNALAAIAAGVASGMSLAECVTGVERIRATEKRGAVKHWRGATLIDDSYNSNPVALDAMVDALLAMEVGERGRRIVVAGEMLELGSEGASLHRACGARMAARGVEQVIGVRGLAQSLVDGAGDNALFVSSPQEAGEWLRANLREGDVALLKASRGVKLEAALESLLRSDPAEDAVSPGAPDRGSA